MRVEQPTENDWNTLVWFMPWLHKTCHDTMIFNAENGLITVKWYIDASFAVCPDFRSHSWASMRFGGGSGCPINVSAKQKINTNSSTTAELVAVQQLLPLVMWVPLFMADQGYPTEKSTLYQDNMSAILLEKNGKKSSSKRTHALNIRYFMVTDQVKNGNLIIEHFPTDKMISDYMMKALQGTIFAEFRKMIMRHNLTKYSVRNT